MAGHTIELAYQRRRRERSNARQWNANTITDVKDVWCPASRVLFGDEDGNTSINRRHDREQPKGSNCIGHNCMAWRWVDHGAEDFGDGYMSPRFGFCGLAGRP